TSQNNVPGCVGSLTPLLENAKSVPLTWTPAAFGQIRKYYVWRSTGAFPTVQLVLLNFSKFSILKTLTGAPPSPSSIDSTAKNNTTYTYFVTEANKQGVQSGPSNPVVVTLKF